MKFLFIAFLITTTAFAGGLSEDETRLAIEKVTNLYAPLLKAKGHELKGVLRYESQTVNGYTLKTGNEIAIHIEGGLARFNGMTADAMSLVVCKEIGNYFGGAPLREGKNTVVQGQSDYFATLKCLRIVFAAEDNVAVMKNVDIPVVVEKACRHSFTNPQEAALCMRSSMAAKVVAGLFSRLTGKLEPQFETPDLTEVKVTNPNHPAPQCRLDTYFSGAVCNASADDDVSMNDEVTGTCHHNLGHKTGVRPACWFKE